LNGLWDVAVIDAGEATRHWYAIHTKPRQESVAEVQLRRQGFEVYCPRLSETKRRRGSWRQVIEPLFPRYLFVRLATGLDNFSPIRSTIGVCDLVRVGRIPKPIPEKLIAALLDREDRERGALVSPPRWQEGMAVEFVEGPFAGIRGIFKAACGNERVLVLLRLLGQDNKVAVEQDTIVPA
jgi:transcriptional antiterminator RfaH